MPIPAGVEKVTVTDGGVPITGPDGTVLNGSLTVAGPDLATVAEDDFLFGGAARRWVTAGRFDPLTLVATDATGINPTGFAYTIVFTPKYGTPWTRYFQLPKASPSVVLADILIPDPVAGSYGALVDPSTLLAKAANLSDVASPSAARTSLGLGSAATQPSSAFDAAGAAAAVAATIPGASGSVTGETGYGQTSTAGTATAYARGDHTHGTPALASSAPATTEAIGTAAATGSASVPARADHVHPMAGAGVPGSSAVGDTAATGSASTFAAADHRHARENFGAVTAQTVFGAASANGSAATVARSDHTHGTPSLPTIQVAAPTGNATADLAAVNAALTAQNGQPAELQLQAGTYLLPAPGTPSNGCISISVNGTVLRGRGIGVTTLRLAGGSSDVTGIIRTPSGTQNSKITFRDFSIDGNAAGQTGTPTVIGAFCGVTPNSTLTDTDIRFENIEIYGCTGYGFDPHERTTRLVLDSCLAHDNGTDGAHDGFTLDGCYDFTMINCKAWNNGRHGMNFVTASTRGQVVGCESFSNGGNGVTLQNGAKYIEFTGCHAYSNTATNWVINGVPQTGQQDNTPGGLHTLTNCHSTLAGQHGFQLVGASNNRLVGCHSQDASQASTNTSDHYRIAESGANFSTNNTFLGCTWGQTSGVTNAAKYGIEEQSSSDGPSYVLGCSGSGTATGTLNLLNGTSLLAAAHNGSSGGHPAAYAYAYDTPSRHGYVEWNYPPDLAGTAAGVAMVAGTVYGMRVDVQAGQIISNIVVSIGTAGSGLTAGQCIASVIDGTTGTELARTGDLSTLLTGTGPTPLPLTASFTPTAAQKIAVMLLANGSGMPLLVRSSSTGVSTPNGGLNATSPRRYFTAGTGQTSMPSSFTMSSTVTTGAFTFWVGLS